MQPVTLTLVISNTNKSVHFEHFCAALKEKKVSFQVILLNKGNSSFEDFLRKEGITVHRVPYFGKKNIPIAIIRMMAYLKKNPSQIVHTHLLDASLVGLTAAFLLGIKKRIHTRHHATYHHQYYPHAVKYDRFINRLSTKIVAISAIVKEVLETKEKVDPEKVTILHHGFNFKHFLNISDNRISNLRAKHNIPEGKLNIGVISRYIELKGVQFIIPAIRELMNKGYHPHLILCNAGGNYAKEIRGLLREQLPRENYTEIEFEEDVYPLFKTFDYFIHVPIDKYCEAFGQVYIEALALKIPSIVTLSGIANEIIADGVNAVVVPYKNSESIADAIVKLQNDGQFRKNITENAFKESIEKFSVDILINDYINLLKD